jgi:hypothetical protein
MCCTPRSKPLLCKAKDHRKEEKEAAKMAEEHEAKDEEAVGAEKDEDEAAAHASAY